LCITFIILREVPVTRHGIDATFVLAAMPETLQPDVAAFHDLVARKGALAMFVSGL